MTRELSARALDWFGRYMDMPANECLRVLRKLEGTDPELHASLTALLAADSRPMLLDRSLSDILPKNQAVARPNGMAIDARIGTFLGPWRIESVLGNGGMGTVYRASRADGHYQRQVALKCIRTELSSPGVIDAFLAERSNLAQIDHPHIAMLLDSGVEESGHPWFAMRYVEGKPIDQWCNEHEVGIRGRVELLAQLCDAIGYAHSRGVLHQDIKPSNLLINADGQLQVLDFGLSSIWDEDVQQRRIAVSYGYSAPEAHSGATPNVATDIYSIGVVMYQLLCGAWPHPAGAAHILQVPTAPVSLRQLAACTPHSEVLLRGRRNARDLAGALRGDLTAIAMKCVAIDATQRYATAGELSAELRRYLAHRPIAVRNGKYGYRLRKFMRRNWISVTLMSALALAGASAFVWQIHRDRQDCVCGCSMSRHWRNGNSPTEPPP